ncbi:1-deoxy-D-xylulose 5-phosphate reductoisomerase [Polynucleobacter sp. SHI8]|uniref:1-deoxy-D-xylulose-5-phosphate reductoisomerase n=1 Tax=unclassified Polynucleobacter TaxID=2640945 RepID=UPI002493C700|nr:MULTISPECIES: 1-deoxy-D-xylulose-5-phosphate reductoisomerase [unclassified Polynucleobacter]BDW11165.1 1-deoxy-D-xylulose 5-phosphate reductoisomerase [Polynucleobacter sp. SHI2]BDW13611.1 1-deoxy-D-xylulose 5-phosphate reductoisomerase [Polynucleobacter sp. SHI8]
MRGLCILGSTGSIGENTLDVVARHPDLFQVKTLTANTQIEKLAKQCIQFQPEIAVVANAELAKQLKSLLPHSSTQVLFGPEGLIEAVMQHQVDTVMSAIVGAAGLLPTIEAAKAGKRILLANKEALVMSGQILMDVVAQSGAELLPIDSEHNAIYQCLPHSKDSNPLEIDELLLTASGGPFLHRPIETLMHVTPEEACAHPNWVMGRKISVDSSTMMNKGLELIEAMWLFQMPQEKIQIVIHPQSVIHSLVRYVDGSLLAQLGEPDMRTPIAFGLGWPQRIASGVKPLDMMQLGQLNFMPADVQRFPAITLAREAARLRGTAPAIMNAANEVAVESFLNRQITYPQIVQVVSQVLENIPSEPATSLELVLSVDQLARDKTKQYILEALQ